MKAPKGDIMNNIQRHSLMCLLALAIGLPATVAIAQDQGAFIEEIIVTAQKREQSLQDVPISVSVVTGDKIVEAGINNLDDLALYVPNFNSRYRDRRQCGVRTIRRHVHG
jgi:outer membrane receptor protein involved in Fe transport